MERPHLYDPPECGILKNLMRRPNPRPPTPRTGKQEARAGSKAPSEASPKKPDKARVVRSKSGAMKVVKKAAPRLEPQLFQLEALPGLGAFLEAEFLKMRIRPQIVEIPDADTFRVLYTGTPEDLTRLRNAQSAFWVENFDVPRPKALLGQQHLDHLLGLIAKLRGLERFRSFRLAAAGADSPTFSRLRAELEDKLDIPYDDERGELLLKVVPGPNGWEVQVRLTPKPLSARVWRVANMEGGLNATVAAAMVDLAGISERDRIFNPMCGSGTLLIERRRLGKSAVLTGCDTDDFALECARQNIGAAGYTPDIALFKGDATALELRDNSFDLVLVDLPWGDDIGTAADLEHLYPLFLKEMARVCTRSARMVVLTHAVKLFEETLASQFAWKFGSEHRVFHGGHHPRMYYLRR